MNKNTFDYIVVGAGSAGSILASRLSEDGKNSVLLMEAGAPDTSPWLKIPIGYAKAYYNPQLNWMFDSQAQAGLGGRSVYCPRGKVVGGSGAINAMVYVRGHEQDFNDWAQAAGDERWSYQSVLPVFKNIETHHDSESDSAYRGKSGPVHITPMRAHAHPLCDYFLQAADELGVSRSPDFNAAKMDGAGIYEINTGKGFRSSSNFSHLKAARQRANLTVLPHAQVECLLFANQEGAAGPQVQGVRACVGRVTHTQSTQEFFAHKEVILCAGAVGSPAILERSGIGDAERLQTLGIPSVLHLPAVGERLQDHLCASFYLASKIPTLNDAFSSPVQLMKMALQYALTRSGPLAMSVNQAGGFFKGRPDLERANLQVYFNPLSYQIPKDGSHNLKPEPYSGFLIAFNPARPTSRGSIHISGKALEDKPLIDPQFLSTQHDIDEVLQGMHLMRKILATKALHGVLEKEVLPGTGVQTDEQMLEYFRQNSGSIYHLCGTCSMGQSGEDSVVDAELRVHGVAGLRIADASVFPNVTTGNTNAPTMMLAEQASRFIVP